MISKTTLQKKAVQLRKEGFSYSEIKKKLVVSQSSLSLWLRKIPLTLDQIKRLEKNKKKGQLKGANKRRKDRQEHESEIISKASFEISPISKKELFLLGILTYWCEGAKQKKWNVSQGVVFSNSDPFLLKVFLMWLEDRGIEKKDISFSLQIHETANIEQALNYWNSHLGDHLYGKTVLKKHQILTNRKYQNRNYYGLIRISVKKSTDLNRQIKGWVVGIEKNLIQCRIV